MTLDDLELTLNGYYALHYITHLSFRARHKNLNEDSYLYSCPCILNLCHTLQSSEI